MIPPTVHKPDAGGLFDSRALCGATVEYGNLAMHLWDYNCPVCSAMAGERA